MSAICNLHEQRVKSYQVVSSRTFLNQSLYLLGLHVGVTVNTYIVESFSYITSNASRIKSYVFEPVSVTIRAAFVQRGAAKQCAHD